MLSSSRNSSKLMKRHHKIVVVLFQFFLFSLFIFSIAKHPYQGTVAEECENKSFHHKFPFIFILPKRGEIGQPRSTSFSELHSLNFVNT